MSMPVAPPYNFVAAGIALFAVRRQEPQRCEVLALSSKPSCKIVIEVLSNRLVATMPGSSFHASYVQQDDTIVQTTAMETDIESSIPREEFEDRAWEAATRKARSLGWMR